VLKFLICDLHSGLRETKGKSQTHVNSLPTNHETAQLHMGTISQTLEVSTIHYTPLPPRVNLDIINVSDWGQHLKEKKKALRSGQSVHGASSLSPAAVVCVQPLTTHSAPSENNSRRKEVRLVPGPLKVHRTTSSPNTGNIGVLCDSKSSDNDMQPLQTALI